ncbi:hypothetical protein PV327_009974 [Microctonus hyperodae]|uniref:Uncharacterized protein n=1 Tax=Microctonus hyperodae TaxID=165561 RepID=A0AA39F234_MICHY|nr:hypothetical protein PV327_009974 [Microctonus hyperodae]
MVASVLLRWKYMWIALAVLTLLFFLACGYTACTNCQRTNGQVITEDATNIQHQRQHIQSICGDVNRFPGNCSQTIGSEPPAYRTYWITDLPPSYATAIGTAEPPTSSIRSVNNTEEIQLRTLEPRLSNPPPYSLVIQPDHTIIHPMSMNPTIINHHRCHNEDESGMIVPTNLPTTDMSRREFVSEGSIVSNQYKNIPAVHEAQLEQSNLSNGTHYFSNFINNAFRRGSRRQFDCRNATRTINREEHGSHMIHQETSTCNNDRVDNNYT